MYYVFNKTCTGYKHIQKRRVCEDYSASYKDNNSIIITCADGHGGDIYIRSNVGSRIASDTVMNVFSGLTPRYLNSMSEGELESQIKMSILCEWNKLVEQQLARKHIKKYEVDGLSEDQINDLRLNPTIAYGTTLTGAIIVGDKLLVVGIGDTEAMFLTKGKIEKVFDDDGAPAGNITYSMCQEDAFKYLKVRLVSASDYDGVMLCTDGLVGPYQSYQNFEENFVKPVFAKIIQTKSQYEVYSLVSSIAAKLGTGDDVSLSFIFNVNTKLKDYL